MVIPDGITPFAAASAAAMASPELYPLAALPWMVTLRTPLNRVIDDGPVVMELVSRVSRGTILPDEDLTEMNFRLSAWDR